MSIITIDLDATELAELERCDATYYVDVVTWNDGTVQHQLRGSEWQLREQLDAFLQDGVCPDVHDELEARVNDATIDDDDV